jgi:ribosomal protein L37AE/L43A
MARPRKHQTDDDRIKAHRAQQNKYGRKIWECDVCSCKLQLGNKSNHFRSKKHANNVAQSD